MKYIRVLKRWILRFLINNEIVKTLKNMFYREIFKIRGITKFLVEVGANDGIIVSKSWDLILNQGWKGLLIEPVRFYFEKLENNYTGNKNVDLLNVAVSSKLEQKKIFRINPKYLSEGDWGHGINSFNRNHHDIKTLEKKFGKDSVLEETVNSYPLSKIFKDRNIEEIDLLIIDTEGHDYEVILSIDFHVVKPKKIIYENKHLGDTNGICENYLRSLGYTVNRKFPDTYCKLN